MARTNWHWKRVNRDWDSKFEKELNEGVLSHCDYHSKETYDYTISHTYHPDFTWTSPSGKIYLIESKGRFETSAEASKYIHIRTFLPENVEIVFLFQRLATPMPRARVRKDGTKATHGEWAARKEFQVFDKETIQELFNEE